MWPMKLDMTRDECRGVLRRLELESYSSVISTFRAQGTLCKEKARVLEELRKLLHISQDRHKAEARRVANDERLTTVAEIITGPNTYQDWCREGRRTFPILPRTTPYTALTYIANTVCEQICRENAKLPRPYETSQNRLEKEQEEEKKKLQEQQEQQQKQQQQPQAQSQLAVKNEADPSTPSDTIKPNHPSVVTVDPFVEAARKSYINNDLKRSYPVDRDSSANASAAIDDESPLRKKPQLYQELRKQEPQSHNVTNLQNPNTLQFSIQPPLSPHKNLSSPNSFGMKSTNTNNSNAKTTQGKNSNKNTERQRKSSVSTKKNQNKTKTPYQSNKQTSGAAKTPKNVIPQQQINDPIPASAKGAGTGRGNNVHSPHLIHSYASPLIPYEIPIPMQIGPEMPSEQLQLQKHISANMSYHPQQGQQPYGTTHMKSHQYSFHTQGQQTQNINPTYGQHQILPSSKKDIQYNLTKLNPTNSSMSMKNNVNIPLKQSSSSIIHGKGHPLLNYQKRSPSKNVLIPTSSAAAALASLGISKPIQRKDSPVGRYRDSEPIVNPADIPNPKIIFSTAVPPSQPQHAAVVQQPAKNQITILDQITLHPPNTIIEMPSASGGTTVGSQVANPVSNLPPTITAPIATPANIVASAKPNSAPATSAANKVVTIKGPSLAGFTPVKGGSKLSVHKLHLMPINQTGNKNNVIVLPAKSTSAGTSTGTLNPGQKISIPKSSVISNVLDPSVISVATNAASPPKVIVQQQPDLNNVVVFDYGSEQKLKTTSGILGSQTQYPPSSKSAITEDTPVDIVSNPLDAVASAVKLQEHSKRFPPLGSPSGSGTTASPLTEKMVKPQSAHPPGMIVTSKYNSNNNINLAKATKFEADSTAPVPAVTVTKKAKINIQGRPASVTVGPLSGTVQNNKVNLKTTAAVASSTTAGADISLRTPAMGSTDWEHELDQATNSKTNSFIPKVAPKTAPQPNVAAAALSKPIKAIISGNSSSINIKKTAQPLSSSSISSTSSNVSSPVTEQQMNTMRIATPRPVIPVPIPTTPTQRTLPLSLPIVTTPPNERSDDTSATDSADAEEDPDVGDDDDHIEEEMIIDDEQHFHAVIEEDPDLDETFNEQGIHGERVEIVNVGYDTSRALIADLEGGESVASMVVRNSAPGYGKTGNGVEINPSSMNFEQYIEEADCDGADANGEQTGGTGDPRTASTVANSRKEIMFEMLEIDADGNKHARTLSYEEALAEGQVDAGAPRSAGGFSGSAVGKSKTKSTS